MELARVFRTTVAGCPPQKTNPGVPSQYVEALPNKALQRIAAKMKPLPAIVTTSDGFCFEAARWAPVSWKAVRRISTYKVDLLTTDEIRLVVEYDEAIPMHIEVSEEQPGFEQFRTFIGQYFCFRDGWWEDVMKPAFSRNQAVLFERAEQALAADAFKATRG